MEDYRRVSEQQIAQQIFQQFADYLSNNVFSYPLIGMLLFGGLLFFFHDFRKWKLSVSFLASLGFTLIFMLIFTPISANFTRLFGL